MNTSDPLLAPMQNTECREVGGLQLDIARAGNSRVKRIIYPPGFRWSTHMKPIVRTNLCMHAHVGFLAHGQIHVEYGDGCTVELVAPQAIAIEPGHDAWVIGDASAVVIEFDFEGETVERLGMPQQHSHATAAR